MAHSTARAATLADGDAVTQGRLRATIAHLSALVQDRTILSMASGPVSLATLANVVWEPTIVEAPAVARDPAVAPVHGSGSPQNSLGPKPAAASSAGASTAFPRAAPPQPPQPQPSPALSAAVVTHPPEPHTAPAAAAASVVPAPVHVPAPVPVRRVVPPIPLESALQHRSPQQQTTTSLPSAAAAAMVSTAGRANTNASATGAAAAFLNQFESLSEFDDSELSDDDSSDSDSNSDASDEHPDDMRDPRAFVRPPARARGPQQSQSQSQSQPSLAHAVPVLRPAASATGLHRQPPPQRLERTHSDLTSLAAAPRSLGTRGPDGTLTYAAPRGSGRSQPPLSDREPSSGAFAGAARQALRYHTSPERVASLRVLAAADRPGREQTRASHAAQWRAEDEALMAQARHVASESQAFVSRQPRK